MWRSGVDQAEVEVGKVRLTGRFRQPARKGAVQMGIILIWKTIVVSFGRQQIVQPATARAGKHATRQPVRGVLESVWSPDAQNAASGVHRSPRRLLLSLLFCAKLTASD